MPSEQRDHLRDEHGTLYDSLPPDYAMRRSVQSILRVWTPVGLVLGLMTAVIWQFSELKWWNFVLVAVAGYLFYRDFWKWQNNYITCSAQDAVLCFEDRAHGFVLLFINGSASDTVPLTDVDMDTPTRSFLDKWVFNCGTLVAHDKTYRDIKDLAALQGIQKYHESIPQRSLDVFMEILKCSRDTYNETKQVRELLAELVLLLKTNL